MNADQYRAILARLGLTHGQAGELLGISEEASQSYASESAARARAIPAPTAKLLRLIASGRVTVRQVEQA